MRYKLIFIYIAFALATHGAESKSPTAATDASGTGSTPEVVVLPKYEITSERVLPPVEAWRYVSLDGFEIISNTSERETKRFLRNFLGLQQVLKIVLPGITPSSAAPTYVVLSGKGKLLDTLEAAISTGPFRSAYLHDAERNAIVVDFATPDNLQPLDEFNISMDSASRSFFLQYCRELLRRSVKPAPPAWLEEGLLQLLANTDFSKDHITFAQLERDAETNVNAVAAQLDRAQTHTGISTALNLAPMPSSPTAMASSGNFRTIFAKRAFIPLEEFFSYSAAQTEKKRPQYFSTQAFLFTHLCLYGQNQRYAGGFRKLAIEASRKPVTEEVFNSIFGMTYKRMQLEMRSYVEFTNYKTFTMEAKSLEGKLAVPPFTLREASEAESGRIIGETLRLAGQKGLALNYLIAPYSRERYDTELIAALGIAELDSGRTERAHKFLEAAIKTKTTRAKVYIEVAKLRAAEMDAKLSNEKRSATPEEIASVREPLNTGIRLPGANAEMFGLLTRLWLASPDTPTNEQFDQLVRGALTYCQDLGLVYRVAELGIRVGRLDLSRQMVAFGLAQAPDGPGKSKFEALSQKLSNLEIAPVSSCKTKTAK